MEREILIELRSLKDVNLSLINEISELRYDLEKFKDEFEKIRFRMSELEDALNSN